MRVRPHRDPTSLFPGNFEQINAEILPIGVAINFNGLVEVRREGKDSGPIGSQTRTEIVNTPARMTQNVNGRIARGAEIALCVVLLPPESRMKTAKPKIQPSQRKLIHISGSRGRQVQLERTKNAQVWHPVIDRGDFVRLLCELVLIDAASVFNPLEWSVIAKKQYPSVEAASAMS